MRNRIAQVKNVRNLADALAELNTRSPGVPGIGLVWGATGAGKTTAVTYLATRQNAIYVRALAAWTPRTMLAAIMKELDAPPLPSAAEMVEFIAEKLRQAPRPIFVDEGDYLLSTKKLIETLRDIHDVTNVPLILIGMADFRQQVAHRPQLAGRVSQWIQFKAIDKEDAATIARELCEVELDDELLELLSVKTAGSVRNIVVGLSRIERFARERGINQVTRQLWAKRELTLAGE